MGVNAPPKPAPVEFTPEQRAAMDRARKPQKHPLRCNIEGWLKKDAPYREKITKRK